MATGKDRTQITQKELIIINIASNLIEALTKVNLGNGDIGIDEGASLATDSAEIAHPK